MSGITLFRMLYPEKYGVSPYRFTIDLLEEFIEALELTIAEAVPEGYGNPFLSRKVPKETALYKLLNINLHHSELKLVLGFMEDLPMEHTALGWECHIIGKALGDFIQISARSRQPGKAYEALLTIPQMRTYYFETYVDYNHGFKVYGASLEEMLRKNGLTSQAEVQALLLRPDIHLIASCLFSYLMLHFFSWLSGDTLKQQGYHRVLSMPSIIEFIEAHSDTFSFIRFRYEAYKLIEHIDSNGKSTALDVSEWVSCLNQTHSGSKPWELEFAAVLLADALVMVGDRAGLERLIVALPVNPVFEPVVEPVYIRARLYRELISGVSDARLEHTFHTPYYLGEGETSFHRLVMNRAMRLFGRKSTWMEEKTALINQTGFIRFTEG